MKYCAQCSREYPDSAKFCTRCGLPLTEGPTEPEAESAAAESPAEPAAEAAAKSDFPEPADAAPPMSGASPASDAKEDSSAIVEAAPAAIEINIPVPEAPAAQPAVAVAEAPPAPPVSTPQEPPAPREEIRRGGDKIGAGRKIGAFFLCIPLFLFLLIPAMIYEVRDASTEVWIANYLEKVPVSDQIDLDVIGYAVEDWLQGLDPELEDVELDINDAASEVNSFIKNANVKGFAAQQLSSYLDALYSGASGAALREEDISELLSDHSDVIDEQLSDMVEELFGHDSGVEVRLTRSDRNNLTEQIVRQLEDAGVYSYLDTGTLREETPVLYYALRFGLSYISAGVSLLLAAAIFICLSKTLKSFLRGANRAGIVLIVLGGLLALLALFPKLLYDPWLQIFNDSDALALFAEEFFFTHILADLIILGAGILLTAATGLTLMIRKKRAVQ